MVRLSPRHLMMGCYAVVVGAGFVIGSTTHWNTLTVVAYLLAWPTAVLMYPLTFLLGQIWAPASAVALVLAGGLNSWLWLAVARRACSQTRRLASCRWCLTRAS